jgi:hypothetical protein
MCGCDFRKGQVAHRWRLRILAKRLKPIYSDDARKNLGGLARLGARFVEEIEYDGAQFLKYRLDTK